jgi:hypothetical protein
MPAATVCPASIIADGIYAFDAAPIRAAVALVDAATMQLAPVLVAGTASVMQAAGGNCSSCCCGSSHLGASARHIITPRHSALLLATTRCPSSTSSVAASCSTWCRLCLLLVPRWQLAPDHQCSFIRVVTASCCCCCSCSYCCWMGKEKQGNRVAAQRALHRVLGTGICRRTGCT